MWWPRAGVRTQLRNDVRGSGEHGTLRVDTEQVLDKIAF